jgi:hypothetical protein
VPTATVHYPGSVESAPLQEDRAAREAGAVDEHAPPGRGAGRRAGAAIPGLRLPGLKPPNVTRLSGIRFAVPILVLSIAVVLWLVSLDRIHPRAMTDLGLITVLPATFFLALLLITVSFMVLVQRRLTSTPLLAAHVLALIAFLHATPAIVYGTLRYAWGWKHLGIVDYIVQHRGVSGAPGIEHLDVYHYWPSFFGLNALLSQLAGLDDMIDLARWAPVVNNVLFLGAVLFVFSALTSDRRVIWLGTWIFFIASWVGQDYFAPQAMALFLYLVALGAVLRWLRVPAEGGPPPAPPPPPASVPEAAALNPRLRAWWEARRRDERLPRRLALAFVISIIVVIASMHALTSGMIILALGVLVLARVCAVRSLPFVAAGIVLLWGAAYAHPYIVQQGSGVLETIRLPWLQAEQNLADVGQQSAGRQLVTTVSRMLVLAIGGLAAVGALRRYRAKRLDRAPVVLAAVPVLLLAGGDYGGEILFRIYLFSTPFLAFLAAYAFLPRSRAPSRSRWPVLASTAVCAGLLGAFVMVYYGKDHQYFFTPQEVAASKHLYRNAPANAYIVDGTANYPRLFEHYDRFNYFTLAPEPPESQREFLARPAAVLSDWLSDPRYSRSFLVITRSQRAEVNDEGIMPPHSLYRIEQSLLRSPRFRVWYRNRDAIIFTLRRERGGAPT